MNRAYATAVPDRAIAEPSHRFWRIGMVLAYCNRRANIGCCRTPDAFLRIGIAYAYCNQRANRRSVCKNAVYRGVGMAFA